MNEHPILFSGEMIRAILDGGRKTQTRRVVKPQPLGNFYLSGDSLIDAPEGQLMNTRIRCPYGTPGDKLWVQETWGIVIEKPKLLHDKTKGNSIFRARAMAGSPSRLCIWRADGEVTLNDGTKLKWQPSTSMPRWASRITLEVTEIRVERVQEISEEDCLAEGIWEWIRSQPGAGYDDPLLAFRGLWDSINGKKYPWDLNPRVWVITFKRVADDTV